MPRNAATWLSAAGLALAVCANSGMAAAKEADPVTLQALIGNPDDFTLTANSRVRYETLDGQARAGFRSAEDLVSLRTIVSAEYHSGNLRLGAELWDSRAFGIDTGGIVGPNEINTVEMVQAYATLALPGALGKGSTASLQAGRMMLNIGSRRLIAADDYRNTTNGYTGLRADAKLKDGTTATALYVLPQIRLPEDIASLRSGKIQMDRENFDTQLWGLFVARPNVIGRTMAELAYVGLAERDAPGRLTRDRNLDTFSARLMADPKPRRFDFEVEAMYQTGTTSNGTAATASKLDVSAWFAHADVGYSFPGKLKARLSVEYDYASGDGPGGKYGRFDTLYGMRRADFVPSGIYAAVGRANISTPGVRFEFAPGKRIEGFVAWHPMWLANSRDAFSTSGVRDATGASGSFAGHSIDSRFRWWAIPKRLRADINASLLLKGRFLENAPNAPRTGNTRYLSTALTAFF
ncbi:alginate export family protein [Novosphingobium sp. JCM 18896]|uniref:alginate export family protein n=1 Tax=Novosphingobium sp. JCM 18896 TaxID=2989731 RepID=UPI002222C55B|nr:alginate export family protein [Novosphingobium sp. JCM 18896]MCW1428023.1 alginate export family protein [Novosphingobium sp. JCM 18896]